MGLPCAGLLVGLAATPARVHLKRRWIWFGVVLGLVIFCPYLVWQHGHGWPAVGYVLEQRETSWSGVSFPRLLAVQLASLHPLNAPLLAAGLLFYLAHPAGRAFRPFGWIFAITLAALAVIHGRFRYGMPEYYLMLPGGCRLVEIALAGARWSRLCLLVPAVMTAAGLAFAPLAIPLLSLERTLAYAESFAPLLSAVMGRPFRADDLFCKRTHYAHFVDEVARVYEELPPEKRGEYALFVTANSEAAAVNTLGPRRGLPRAFSTLSRDFDRGLEGFSGDRMIVVTRSPELFDKLYYYVREVARVESSQRRCDGRGQFRDLVFLRCHWRRLPLEDALRVIFEQADALELGSPARRPRPSGQEEIE
jgi:hypothetical protein